jgi:DNA-binding transcriptional ArsR family regulator
MASLLFLMPLLPVSVGIPHRGPAIFDARYGSSPIKVDGVFNADEWENSTLHEVVSMQNVTVELYLKEDGSDLFICFKLNRTHEYQLSQVWIDANDDKGLVTDGNDYQLDSDYYMDTSYVHEMNGAGGKWTSAATPIKWGSVASASCIEYSIEYLKLGLVAGEERTIGLALNWFGEYGSFSDPQFPLLDPDSPATWGSLNSSDLWRGPIVPNTPPTLSGGAVHPTYGFTDTDFSFQVEYYDADADAPVVQNVIIDGSAHGMEYVEYTGYGYLFEYTTALGAGDHSYHFDFSDGENSTRYPASGELQGLKVYEPNLPPYLVRGAIPNGTFVLEEDQMTAEHLIDLEEFFSDDRDDGNLTFTIVDQEDRGTMVATIEGMYLSVEQKVPNWHGELNFQVEAADNGILGLELQMYQLRSLSNPFRITVASVNDAPSFDSVNEMVLQEGGDIVMLDGDQSAVEDIPYTISLKASDPDASLDGSEVLEFSLDDEEVALEKVGKGSATLSFTPAEDDVGFRSINLTVEDRDGSRDDIEIIVRVVNANDPPAIVSCMHNDVVYPALEGRIEFPDGLSAVEDEPFELMLVATDPDMIHGSETFEFGMTGSRDDVELDPEEGILRFYPEQSDVGTVTVRGVFVVDRAGVRSASVDIVIPVLNRNDPPEIKRAYSSTGSMTFTEGDGSYIALDYIDTDMGYDNTQVFVVTWTSDIDGDLGRSELLYVSRLSPGVHRINATISDSKGGSDTYGFQLTVEERTVTVPGEGPGPLVFGGGALGAAMVVVILILISFLIYSRAKEKSVLDNMNRKLIFEAVKLKPGVHFMALSEQLGLAIGVLSHHLNILEKNQYVKSMQDGKFRRFYLYDEKIEYKLTLTAIQQAIIYIVKQDPGITQSHISERMGKNKMVVNYHIKILKDVGLLVVERNGRETNCFPTTAAMGLT